MISEYTKEQKKRLLSKYSLEKIILFGSQAKGTADVKSDVDILVVTDLKEDKFKLMTEMSGYLLELKYAFDVIVLSSEEYARDIKYPGTVARYASKEGIVLYENGR